MIYSGIAGLSSIFIELTAREFEILNYMAENIGRVISRERLYETIWGEDSFGCDNTIEQNRTMGKLSDPLTHFIPVNSRKHNI